ncbi:hypothetical protein ACIQI7_15175 [Kitasatospora sp. NPDC092039]|uniref:hypothetical protein n=1 Tax=Kitasatospora sp. NPDC092039 TaxID=3364086 RepID=UPI00381FCD9E
MVRSTPAISTARKLLGNGACRCSSHSRASRSAAGFGRVRHHGRAEERGHGVEDGAHQLDGARRGHGVARRRAACEPFAQPQAGRESGGEPGGEEPLGDGPTGQFAERLLDGRPVDEDLFQGEQRVGDGDGGELVAVVGVPDEFPGGLQCAHDARRGSGGHLQAGDQVPHPRIVRGD